MVTINSASKVLREVYLDVLSKQLNDHTSVFYSRIKKDSENISNNMAIALGRFGINGGVGSPIESADLPKAGPNSYVKLKAEMRNIYGTIELSDKVLRANANSINGLVNVLNEEMEGLLSAAKFNFSRMLFQKGDGVLGIVTDKINQEGIHPNSVPLHTTKNVIEGMIVDVVAPNGTKKISRCTIAAIDRQNKDIKLGLIIKDFDVAEGDYVVLQDSYQSEIFGIPYIFDENQHSIYGVMRITCPYLYPTIKSSTTISGDIIQETIDDIEEAGGCQTNLLICSYDVRRKYFNHLAESRMNIDYMNLDGGFKALSYNGIPLVTDRFAPDNKMYLLNTDDFKLAQLNDWNWIESATGKVLRQMDNKAAYSATLVKYANLICTRPIGQGVITLTES